MATESAELIAKLSLDNARFKKQLKEARDKLKEFGDEGEDAGDKVKDGLDGATKSTGTFAGAAKKLAPLIGAAFAADTLIQFGKNVISTTAEFQKMEAVLTNTLGSSSAAKVAMDEITDFASKTPFAVQELTEAFVKLANRGFVPTQDQMRSLGDLASSTGKSFDQLTEAALDAMTGEFERLKEFGIRASAEGDKVQFTFKGVTTEVEKTDQAIKDYIISLGDAKGVSGSMAAISNTVGGQISNLGDNFTQLYKAIGDSSSGLISGILNLSNALVGNLAKSFDAVNTVTKKQGEGGFTAFIKQLATILDPTYAKIVRETAEAYKAADKAINDAMIAGRAHFEAEGKAREELESAAKLLSEEEKKRAEASKKAHQEKIKELRAEETAFNRLTKVTTSARTFIDLQRNLFSQEKLSKIKELTDTLIGSALRPAIERGIIVTDKDKERIEANIEALKRQNKELSIANSITSMLGDTFQSAFEGMLNTGKVSFKGIIDGLKALIIKLVSAAAAAAVLAGILAATGLGAAGGFLSNFKNIFGAMSGLSGLFGATKMAEGGMVTGITTAILGDNPSGKEVVIPFEKMSSFLNQYGTGGGNMRVEVVGRLAGEDIYFSGVNYSNSRNKILGS